MFYFSTLLIMFFLLLATVVLGRRLADCLPGRLQPVARTYFSPLLGTALLILMATVHGWLLAFQTWACLSELCLLTAAALYFEKDKKGLQESVLRVCLFAVIASSTVLFPVLIFDCFNSFTDTFTYLVHGQWLQSHPFRESITGSGHFPALSQVVLYQSAGHRMGASFLLGWVQSSFGLRWSYDAYPAVLSLGLVGGALAVGGAVKFIVRGQRWVSWLAALATATLFNGYTFGAMYGFFPQTFGLAFSVGGVTLLGRFLMENRRFPRVGWALVRNIFPLAIIFSALSFSYNDFLLIVGAGIVSFLGIFIFFHRNRVGSLLFPLAVLLGQVILLINVEFVRIVRNFIHTVLGVNVGDKAIGWPVLWSPFEFLAHAFGFRSAFSDVWLFYNSWVSKFFFLVVLLAIGYFLYKERRRFSPLVLIHLCLLGVLTAAFFKFRYATPSPRAIETGYTFLQYKISQWASPFGVVLLGAMVAGMARRFPRWSRIFAGGFCGVILTAIAGNVRFAKMITSDFLNEIGSNRSAFSTLVQLRDLVKGVPTSEPIYLNLGNEHHKLRQMVAYVLQDRLLSGDYTDDGYITGHLPPNERSMPFDKAPWVLGFATPQDGVVGLYPRLGNLLLQRRPPALFNRVSITGGYDMEKDGINTWNWTSKSLDFRYRVLGKTNLIRLRFGYMPATEDRDLICRVVAGEKSEWRFKMKGGWNDMTLDEIPVTGEEIVVSFLSEAPAVRISPHDHRMMSFLIRNMTVENADPQSGVTPRLSRLPELVSVEGGYDQEKDGSNWRYWTSQQLIFSYRMPKGATKGLLKFTYMPASDDRKVDLIVRSRTRTVIPLTLKGGWNEMSTALVDLRGPDVVVEFVSKEKPVRISNQDSRPLSFLIQNLEVILTNR